MRVALTGAGGRLGYFLHQGLARADYTIHPLDRAVHGDLSQPDFRPFLARCQGLVHAAFDHAPGKYRGGEGNDPLGFWDRNFQSTLRLLEQAREVGIQKVVLFSSRAVYGAHQQFHAPIEEPTPAQPDTHYGALKLATEQMAPLYSDTRMQVTVLRPTGIYGGPASINKWTPMFLDAMQGTLPGINKTASEVHGKTIASATIMALRDHGDAMAGQTFNLSEVIITTAQILAFAGFDTAAMPVAKGMAGPELSSRRLQTLGLPLKGQAAVAQGAQDLHQELLASYS